MEPILIIRKAFNGILNFNSENREFSKGEEAKKVL